LAFCFHCRNSLLDFSALEAAELRFTLLQKAAALPIEVNTGKPLIEVRPKRAGNGRTVMKII
jgi:trehalose-6-phosphatase